MCPALIRCVAGEGCSQSRPTSHKNAPAHRRVGARYRRRPRRLLYRCYLRVYKSVYMSAKPNHGPDECKDVLSLLRRADACNVRKHSSGTKTNGIWHNPMQLIVSAYVGSLYKMNKLYDCELARPSAR